MDDIITALTHAYSDYRTQLVQSEQKQKPTDGLFGFGHSIKDDPCHEQLDGKVCAIVKQTTAEGITPQQAAEAARLIFTQTSLYTYPPSAQWMLFATERHILLLIPSLSREDAASLCREYGKRYKPWDRLPVQKDVHRALKQRSSGN